MTSTKPTVLVVDDVQSNLSLINALLEEDFGETTSCDSGQACLAALGNADPLPDILLLDLLMPEMDGFELCERIKANSAWAQIPIIFVTSEQGDDERMRAYEIGADDFITKPLNRGELITKIKKCISVQERINALTASGKGSADESASQSPNLRLLEFNQKLQAINRLISDFATPSNPEQLADALLEAIDTFQLVACLQITLNDQTHYFGQGCLPDSTEAKLLHAAQHSPLYAGEMIITGRRAFFCAKHLTILIKNMPTHLPSVEQAHINQLMLMLLRTANLILSGFQRTPGLNASHTISVSDQLQKNMHELGDQLHQFGKTTVEVLNLVHSDFDKAFYTLHLTEDQESALHSLFDVGYERLDKLQAQEDRIIASFDQVLKTIENPSQSDQNAL